MEKTRLLDKLDKATDRAVSIAMQQGFPMSVSGKVVLIGNTYIEKNKKGLYDLVSLTRKPLYPDILSFDIAIIIAQRHLSGEKNSIKKILQLQERFEKYHLDMIHYLHCMKGAKKQKDNERFFILEDKYRVAETFAKRIKDSISSFKRLK